MPARQLLISAIVLVSLSRVDRRRAKAITRSLAIGMCRRALGWLSRPYQLRLEPCIVFAPHQDDETIGCGGLIARKRNEGLPVHVVFITDGGASHPGHPRLAQPELRAIRRSEAMAALAILGVESTAIHFLDEADGTLNNLTPERKHAAQRRITRLLEEIQPAELFVPCFPDGSTEHDAVFHLVGGAVAAAGLRPEVWEYPVWSWWNPMLLLTRLVSAAPMCVQPTEDFAAIKAHALDRYQSQVRPTPPWIEPLLPAELVKIFNSDREFFFRFDLPPPHFESHPVRVI